MKTKKLIIGGSGTGKTNSWFNLTSHHSDIDKVYLYANDPFAAKYQLLIKKTDLKLFNDSKASIEYSNDVYDIYKNLKNIIKIKNKKYWLLSWFEHWHA